MPTNTIQISETLPAKWSHFHSASLCVCVCVYAFICLVFIELDLPFLFCLVSVSTAKLAAGQPKHLLFEVQPGSDATALWKVVVRVLCTKVRPRNRMPR